MKDGGLSLPTGYNHAMQQKWVTFIKILFAVLVWGASFVATKVALQNGFSSFAGVSGNPASSAGSVVPSISPVTVVWLRFAMGVVVLGLAVVGRGQLELPSVKDLGYFAVLGFLGITFHQWLQSTGLVTSQATTTAWIVATTPVFIAVLGWLVLKEKFGWLRGAGILLAGIGVLLVVSEGRLSGLFSGGFGNAGDRLIMMSAPNWAIFSVFSRYGLKRHPAARMMFFVMGLGWLFTSVQLFAGPGLSEIPNLTAGGWLGVGFLGIFCSGIAYIFWYDALQALPASQVGVFLYFEPLVTVGVAAIVLKEALIGTTLLGGAIILFGVWMVNRPAPNKMGENAMASSSSKST